MFMYYILARFRTSLALAQRGINIPARSVVCSLCDGDRTLTPSEEFVGDWQCEGCKSVNYGTFPEEE